MHTRSLFSGMFLLVAVLTEAAIALSHPRESSLTVLAHGPAGLRIEGKSAGVLVEEDASALTVKVPIAPIDTGIGLRGRPLREMLGGGGSGEHTAELQSPCNLVCRPLLVK